MVIAILFSAKSILLTSNMGKVSQESSSQIFKLVQLFGCQFMLLHNLLTFLVGSQHVQKQANTSALFQLRPAALVAQNKQCHKHLIKQCNRFQTASNYLCHLPPVCSCALGQSFLGVPILPCRLVKQNMYILLMDVLRNQQWGSKLDLIRFFFEEF